MRAKEFITESVTAYHGTYGKWEGDFRTSDADIGIHFGSKEAAEKRLELKQAENERDGGRELTDPSIEKYTLDLNNPLRMNEQSPEFGRAGGNWRPERVWAMISRSFDDGNPLVSNVSDEEADAIMDEDEENIVNSKGESLADSWSNYMREWLVQWLNDKGYDGIVYNNEFEGGGDSYIVFHPNQVRKNQTIKLRGFNRPH